MANVTITPIRGRFPRARPRPARRGMGDDNAFLQVATAPFTLGSNFASALWNMPSAGYATPAQVKAESAIAITQAATDPNTGAVNIDLANAQIAAANTQIDAAYASGMAIPASQLAGLPNYPSFWSWLSSLFGGDGSDPFPSGFPWTTLLVIGGLGIGGYFLYKAVK